MAYQRRTPANPNKITIVVDFDTLDRVLAIAKERKVDKDRAASELLQERVGTRPLPEPAASSEPDDGSEERLRRTRAFWQPSPPTQRSER